MSQAVAARPRWMISTRASGEVFAAGAESDESQIVLLGIPAGFTGQEVEGWLQDVIGVARETSRQDTDERPIPVLLHHTLTGLLFSHTELWDRAPGSQPCSVAFVQVADAVGFGWVGEGEPVVWLNGEAVSIQWVRVRDHSGREARAFAVDARHRVQLELDWSELPGATGVPGILLQAAWNPGIVASAGQDPAAAPQTIHATPDEYASMVAAVENPETPSTPQTLPPVFGMPGLPSSAEPYADPPLEIETAFDPGMDPAPAPPESAPAWDAVPETSEPVGEAPVAQPDPLVPSPAKPLGWTTVYEADGSGTAQRDPASDERRRGFFSWVSGLMRGGAKPEAETEPRPPRPRAPEVAAEARPPAPAIERAASPPTAEPQAAAAPTPIDEPVFDVPSFGQAAPDVREPPLPEMVPPSPEPAELTARTVDWRPAAVRPLREAPSPDWAEAALAANQPLSSPGAGEIAPEPPASAPRWTRPSRSWPTLDEPPPPRRSLVRKPWAWVALIAALFAGGWLVGALQEDRPAASGPNPLSRALRGLGIGGARYDLAITTRPPGAWIFVDGKDVARRTPATIELKPGEHTVTLSLADLGVATYSVRGERGDKVTLDAPLSGSLAIRGSDSGLPIAVSVDGRSLGFVPITLDSLTPGAHDVRFSGPGMASWGNTVTVRVGEVTETIAHPMTSPATGMIEVRALAAGSEGSEPMSGAVVWVDGERRGTTPFTVELPRGPHSVRVEYQGETAPVQVIDLPGGNQRFATFEFGLDVERGQLLALAPPARIPLDRPTVISAALQGVSPAEVREMWLHLRTPDGSWRRYQMTLLKATGGVVGTAVYPPTMFDEHGRARWYVSASTQTGDEYFTEILWSEMAAPARTR